MEECNAKKLTIEDAYKILMGSGYKVTLQEAEGILDFLYKIAEIIISDGLIH